MFKLNRMLLAGALVALASTTSMAAGLGPGGLQGGGGVVTMDTSSVWTATKLTVNGGYTLTGDFGSLFGITGMTDAPVVLDTTNINAFTITQASSGFTFQAIAPPLSDQNTGISPTFGGRAITLWGVATRGALSNGAVLSMSFSQTPLGDVSSSFSLSVVPEPSSVALAGIGLAAAGLFGLRKRLAK
jgi:hypothetical protein